MLSTVDLQTQAFSTVQQKLKDSFRSISYSALMPNSVICSGEFGLDGFYSHQIHHLLDWMDVDHSQYADFYQMFNTLCRALTEKLGKFVVGRSNESYSTSASTGPLSPLSGSVPAPKSPKIIEVEAFVERTAAHSWAKFVETLLRDYPHPLKPLSIQALRDMDKSHQHRKITLVSVCFSFTVKCLICILPSSIILITTWYMVTNGQQLLTF